MTSFDNGKYNIKLVAVKTGEPSENAKKNLARLAYLLGRNDAKMELNKQKE